MHHCSDVDEAKDTCLIGIPDTKVHGANMRPTWVLSALDGPHVGHMKLAIGDIIWHAHGRDSNPLLECEVPDLEWHPV